MITTQKYAILLSFLGLWLTSYLTTEFQTMLGLALIFSFGILHGANDLQLINHFEKNKKIHFFKILGSYIVLVLLSVMLFFTVPIVALVIFIAVSAYHFGEQNWQLILQHANKNVRIALQFSYGLVILSALFYFNFQEVELIIFKIATVKISEYQFGVLFLISIIMYLICSIVVIKENRLLQSKVLEQTFLMLLLFVIFKVASLILGFAIYFILWHSIPSMEDQIKFLYGNFTLGNFKKYFKAAFWYWLVSLIGVFMLFAIAKNEIFFDALFFSFLASITFPHFIVIVLMYSSKKQSL